MSASCGATSATSDGSRKSRPKSVSVAPERTRLCWWARAGASAEMSAPQCVSMCDGSASLSASATWQPAFFASGKGSAKLAVRIWTSSGR